MSGVVWLTGGLVLGVAGALLSRRRPQGQASQPGADPALLPDPALRWLVQARGARAAWVSTPPSREGGVPGWQRFISEDPLGAAGGANLFAYAANQPTLSIIT